MSQRAIFLDRDNTIIDNDGYLGDPSRVKLLPGAATALAALRALGYRLIVVSNQSGVARGLFSEQAVEAVNDEMSRQLRQKAGAYIDASYYCPYHPDAPLAEYRIDHEWRKPASGMLKQAAVDFSLDLSQCWMVGDQDRDITAGARVGCRTILLRDPNRRAAPVMMDNGEDDSQETGPSPSFVVKSLADAARIIAREGRQPPPKNPAPSAGTSTASVPSPPPTDKAPLPPADSSQHVPPPTAPVEPRSEPSVPAAQVIATGPAPSTPTAAAPLAAPDAPPPPPPDSASAAPEIPAQPRLEKSLEDLLALMRRQHRSAELHPEFTFSHMATLLLQVFAIVAMVIGMTHFFNVRASFDVAQDWWDALYRYQAATVWLLAALVLQGMVVSLLLYIRQK